MVKTDSALIIYSSLAPFELPVLGTQFRICGRKGPTPVAGKTVFATCCREGIEHSASPTDQPDTSQMLLPIGLS